MDLSIIAYVSEMERSVAFYDSLGFRQIGKSSPMWTAYAFGGAMFALHRVMTEELPPASDRLTLNIAVSGEELQRLYALCQERGYQVSGPITDVGFGPHFRVTDPDGLPIQFNERTR
ncbi:MAG TPA: VOC family protein [Thermomicrobiales bacterium]|nr:VOC family protein [Thermomicrobiales bacterium]